MLEWRCSKVLSKTMKAQLNDMMIEHFASGYTRDGNPHNDALLNGEAESASQAMQLNLKALTRERELGLKYDPSEENYFLDDIQSAQQIISWIKELGEEAAIQKCLESEDELIRSTGAVLDSQDYTLLAF